MKSLSVQMKILIFISNVLLSHQAYQDTNKVMLFKWKTPEFDYPSEEARYEAIELKKFVPTNVLIMDADYYAPTGRYFVTTPLFRSGIPSSLSEVIGPQAILRPFPRWPTYDPATNTLSCNGLHSVFRVQIDKCGHMWVLDSGLNYGGADPLDCPPKLLIYDLNYGDREIFRFTFPKGNYSDISTLTTFAIESYNSDCSDSIVYITDERGHGLVVFDYAKKASWRIDHPSFYPYPEHHLFNVNGVVYSVMAGLFGIALGPNEYDRKLYFHSFSSVKESWAPVAILKNRTMATSPAFLGPRIITSSGERASQSTVEVMTDDGILIYHVLSENSLVCWNSKTPFTIENQYTLARDDVNFQYIGSLKLKDNNLLITSCRYQNYLYGIENATEFNYRVMVIEDVKRLLANTPCVNSASNDLSQDTYVDSRFFSSPDTYSYNSELVEEPNRAAASDGQYNTGSYGEVADNTSPYKSYPQSKSVYGFQYFGSQNPYSNNDNWYLRTVYKK